MSVETGAMDSLPLLSVIVPVYGTEKFLGKCLDSLLEESYPNMEIIVVDDCSPDQSYEIIQDYMERYENIRCVRNAENQGLFKARLRGYEVARGEYICSVDSDDYVGMDYHRLLMMRALETDADIVVSKFVIHNVERNTLRYRTYGNYAIEEIDLSGKDIILDFFHTEGENSHRWLVWNKVYKKELWDRSYEDLLKLDRHQIMLEDLAYGTVFMTNAKRYVSCEADTYFYVKHPEASTGLGGNYQKLYKNLNDQVEAFQFSENFLRARGLFDSVADKMQLLRQKQARVWVDMGNKYALTSGEKQEAAVLIQQIAPQYDANTSCVEDPFFYREHTPWDNRLEKLKKAISSPEIRYISFDMFDTLVLRPFFHPSDLFRLLNRKYDELTCGQSLMSFSDMRVRAERHARQIYLRSHHFEDITIDEIYQTLEADYQVPHTVAMMLQQEEERLEVYFCIPRKKVKEIYEFALFMGKKPICITDIYLNRETIEAMLAKAGYTQLDAVIISSEERITKASGHLFEAVLKQFEISPEEILHIGDNWASDIVNARAHKMTAYFTARAAELFSNRIPDVGGKKGRATFEASLARNPTGNYAKYNFSKGYLGFRCMLALTANRIFDHPYLPYEKGTDFNRNPYYIGYFALGMHVYGIVRWLLELCEKQGYRTIHFVARDGYIAMKVYEIVSKYYPNAPRANYFYMSRKSFLPLIISKAEDLYMLPEFAPWKGKRPLDYIEMLLPLLEWEGQEEAAGSYRRRGVILEKTIDSETEYRQFIDALIELSYSQRKTDEYRSRMRQYFSGIIGEKDIMFDIGYSGRAQAILSLLLGRSVDAAYVHYLNDKAMDYAGRFHFRVYCYYNYVPAIIGKMRELIQSDTIGSCIGYEITETGVEPVLENSSYSYHAKFVMKRVHQGACDFAKDFMETFSEYMEEMHYRDFDLGFAHEYYLHHPTGGDMQLFSVFYFEDDVLYNKQYSRKKITDTWWGDLKWGRLKGGAGAAAGSNDYVEISSAPRWKAACYYALFDRKTLKDKAKSRLGSRPLLYRLCKTGYTSLKGVYKGVRRIYTFFRYPVVGKKKDCSMKVMSGQTKLDGTGKILYSAVSEYGILCCMIHKQRYNADKSCILMISEWRKNKLKLLEETGLFEAVYVFSDNALRKISFSMNGRMKTESSRQKCAEEWFRAFEIQFPFAITSFSEIIVTNNAMSLGLYLEHSNIAYAAFEDAAGVYSDPTLQRENVQMTFPAVEQWLIETYKCLEGGGACQKWYINYAAQKKAFSKEKTEDFSPCVLLNSLSESDRSKILSVFGVYESCTEQGNEKSCLILTYPLADRMKISKADQQFIYACFADLFSKGLDLIYIKPHPDDHVDYSTLSEIEIIPSGVLSELLSYRIGGKIQRAVSAVSTALNNLSEINEKIYFDSGITAHYKELIRYWVVVRCIAHMMKAEDTIICIGTCDMILNNLLSVSEDENLKNQIIYHMQDMQETVSGKRIYILGTDAEEKDLESVQHMCTEQDIMISFHEFMGANTLQISKNRLRGAYLSDLEDEFLYIKYQCKSERPLHFEQIMKIMNIRIIVKEL